jgi:plastocyanin
VVKAGAGGFHFEPAELANVSVGDVVTFEFYPPDHSVARAEYGSACVPYEYTGRDRTGFWSETQWVKTPNDVSTPHDFSGPRLLANGARLPIGT